MADVWSVRSRVADCDAVGAARGEFQLDRHALKASAVRIAAVREEQVLGCCAAYADESIAVSGILESVLMSAVGLVLTKTRSLTASWLV